MQLDAKTGGIMEDWVKNKLAQLPSDVTRLQMAFYLACSDVVLNMGGDDEECMQHFLKMADQWLSPTEYTYVYDAAIRAEIN